MRESKWIVLVVVSIFYVVLNGCEGENVSPQKELGVYLKRLDHDPSNCILLGRIAALYQATSEFRNAVVHYEKSLSICPNDLFNRFQLGISYYLLKEKENGILHMDEAIKQARDEGRMELAKALENEKKLWLEKWQQVLEMQ
ncbi:MAG: hypothetical protein GXP09_03860 [Gammaproteobacteria bacterium]|nr:hypothetical protein [Gammaproteobacteria bacterium]